MKKQELLEKRIEDYRGREFKTMAAAKNTITKSTIYTSSLKKAKENPKLFYVGRGSGAGFKCKNGLYNQFIDLAKEDGKWTNEFVNNMFLETWKDSSRTEEIEEWKQGKLNMAIRLFVKEKDSKVYKGYGIYYRSGSSQSGVLWRRL